MADLSNKSVLASDGVAVVISAHHDFSQVLIPRRTLCSLPSSTYPKLLRR
jgi:hypothetical protein